MRKSMLALLFALAAVFFLSNSMAEAGEYRMSQDPEALAFIGRWEGNIEGSQGETRSLEIVLADLQDNGDITCKRYHLGPLGRDRHKDIGPRDVKIKKAVVEKYQGKFRLIVTTDRFEIIYAIDSGKLVRESTGTSAREEKAILRKVK